MQVLSDVFNEVFSVGSSVLVSLFLLDVTAFTISAFVRFLKRSRDKERKKEFEKEPYDS